MSSFGRRTGPPGRASLGVWFFDCLHLDGEDLLDRPLVERAAALDRIGVPRVPSLATDDLDAALAFQTEALAAGHEGVMVKAVGSPYEAGRRGAAWRKVKPVHTLDLVVLAAEWGSGRRQGWLSNLHLGARDPDGGFVMVGKTFKGLTDALLEWQTAEFLARESGRPHPHVVEIDPPLVVEIALDGVQASTRYAGGVALRFARVRRYRARQGPGRRRHHRRGPHDAPAGERPRRVAGADLRRSRTKRRASLFRSDAEMICLPVDAALEG